MTVSTPYFDFVFEAKQEVAEELEYAQKVSARLDRKQERLEQLVSIRPSAKRLRRLAKTQALSDLYDQEIEELTGELAEYNAVELPKDSIDVSFWDGITGLSMTITDSPYDDTYVGGSVAGMKVRGTGFYNGKGWSSYGLTAGKLVANDWAPIDGQTTVGFGLNKQRIDGSYPDVTVSLVDADYNQLLTQTIYKDGVCLI